METASSAVVSSRSIQNEANREELISRLFQVLFCCNIFMCYGYTYFTASNPWVMLATHVVAVTFHFFPKASDNNVRGMSLIFAPWTTYIKEAFPLSTSSSAKSFSYAGVDFNDTILSLFVLTPLRVYSSGNNKGVLYLYFSLASIYPLLVTRWSYLLGGLVWGCLLHSPLFLTAVGWIDTWSIFASATLYTLCCLWFSTQNKACKTANDAKNTFLSNIGHEVRTPLHGIMGSIDALRSEVERITMGNREANKTLEWLDVMHGCSVSLSEILDNMILLSKLDSNATIVKGSPVKEEFAIRPFMKEIANLAFAYPKAQTVRFQYVVSPDVPALCFTDRIGLRQVVINMVTNGLKFTTAGNVILRVYVSKDHKNMLCFELADTGCGMSEDFMKRIFRPFSQENVAPARSHRGAGLGLFISATIAHRMDASISVMSKKGLGTTMCLSVSQPERIFDPVQQQVLQQSQGSSERVLPCVLPSHISSQKLGQRRHTVPFVAYRRNSDVAVLVDKENVIQTLSPPSSPEAGVRSELQQSLSTVYENDGVRSPMLGTDIGRRASGAIIEDYDPYDENGSSSSPPVLPLALIVDDNPVNIKVLTHCLINIGFQITAATSGEQAVELATRTAYDICFLDVFMPKMNGFETARALRSLPKHTPRMIVGCSADTRVIDECKAAGMTEFLQKPFKKDALKHTYETLVKLIETEGPRVKAAE